MSEPKYRKLPGGTEVAEYGDKMVVYCKGSGVPPPPRKVYFRPNPFTPPPPPPSPRELLRQQLGLDTIGHPTKKNKI